MTMDRRGQGEVRTLLCGEEPGKGEALPATRPEPRLHVENGPCPQRHCEAVRRVPARAPQEGPGSPGGLCQALSQSSVTECVRAEHRGAPCPGGGLGLHCPHKALPTEPASAKGTKGSLPLLEISRVSSFSVHILWIPWVGTRGVTSAHS